LIRASLARLYLRAYHKAKRGPRFVEVLGERFLVLPRVFSPVSAYSTELVAKNLAVRKGDTVLDVGCGSGVLAVLAAKRGARVVAVDASEDACLCTKLNAKLHGVAEMVDVRAGDLYEPVRGEQFDLVISNPPYLPLEPRDELDKLWCCGRGLGLLKRLVSGLPLHMKPGGRALLTFSSLTGVGAVEKALRRAGLAWRVVDEVRTPLDTIFLAEIRARGRITSAAI
jgi:release factor glutamine methyltransferase